MEVKMNVQIMGTGKNLPRRVVENTELEGRMGLSPGWIEKRTGIKSRRYIDEGTCGSDLALPACRQALEVAGVHAKDIDIIIGAQAVPDQAIPATSCFVQHGLGVSGSMCFDINATCFSFPVALFQAAQLISSGQARHVLVFSGECASLGLDFEDPESASLFGDGAAAVVLGPAPAGSSSQVLGMKMKTYSEGRLLAELRAGGARYPPSRFDITGPTGKFHMDGKAIFKSAARHGEGFLDEFFARTLPQPEWKHAIPHQTSLHGVSIYSRRLGFREDQVISNLVDHGNCIAASIPMGLHDAVVSGRVQRGDPVLLMGTAAGLTLGVLGLVW
jgi:3-oxoacyl-[acyl-carrier-protein] synthase III